MTLQQYKQRLAILASGKGLNARQLLEKAKSFREKGEFLVIITDNPLAPIKETLKEYEVPIHVIPYSKINGVGEGKRSHEKAILDILIQHKIDWVFLAGYMRILSFHFLEYFWCPLQKIYQVVNIHPSLLPNFPGRDGFGDAFRAGVNVSGITVHLVDKGVDTGPVLAQEEFNRLPTDHLESFINRGKEVELRLYPFVLEQILLGNLKTKELNGKTFPYFSNRKGISSYLEGEYGRI